MENNLSETAFVHKENGVYRLRWFTPGGEVELCGHATLASAYVITHFYEQELKVVLFDTLSGRLTAERKGDLFSMNFPSFELKTIPVNETIIKALGAEPKEVYIGADTVCVFENEEQVLSVRPDLNLVRQLYGTCLHITAPGIEYDCVTRSFAPKCNVAEDPVCGRGHCHVVPYWADKLGKTDLTAYQASARGGTLYCRYEGERTLLSGNAVLYSESKIYI